MVLPSRTEAHQDDQRIKKGCPRIDNHSVRGFFFASDHLFKKFWKEQNDEKMGVFLCYLCCLNFTGNKYGNGYVKKRKRHDING